jgi:hypothetical protein
MAANATLVPDLCDRLFTVFTAAAPAAALLLPPAVDGSPALLAVIDGPPVGDTPDNYVAVGYSGAFAGQAFTGTTGLAVEGTWGQSAVGNRIPFEVPEIQCECSTWSGDADPAAMSRQRRRTGIVLSALLAAIAADPSLGGVVTGPAYAAPAKFRWLLDQPREGVSCTVQFSVGVVGEAWQV